MIIATDPPFNAIGDGIADDTSALQAALNAALAGPGHLYIPAGRYKVTASLVIDAARTIHVQGASVTGVSSWGGTQLVWAGNAITPLLRCVGMIDALLEDFVIAASSTAPLAVGIQCENAPSRNSQRNTFRNLFVTGDTNTDLDKGFCFAKGAGVDGNNDSMRFDKVRVFHTGTAAFSFEHQQSLTHTFTDCHVSYGARAVSTALGMPGAVGGSFRWYGGLITSMSVADFDLGAPSGGYILISGVHSEGSARLLQTGGPSTNALPVTLHGVKWAANNLHADGNMIVYKERGPLVIRDSRLGSGPRLPYILLSPNGKMYCLVEGVHFETPGSDAVDPVRLADWGPSSAVVFRRANTYQKTGGGIAFRVGD